MDQARQPTTVLTFMALAMTAAILTAMAGLWSAGAQAQDWRELSWGDSPAQVGRHYTLRPMQGDHQFALASTEIGEVQFTVLATFGGNPLGLERIDLSSFELLVEMREAAFQRLFGLLSQAFGEPASADLPHPPVVLPRDRLWSFERSVLWVSDRTQVSLEHLFAPIWAESQTGSDIVTISYTVNREPPP